MGYNNEILVSVIIPVYKVERYLMRCVDSVLSQSHDKLQVILVDDGSPDACPDICDLYASQNLNVEVIHKQNGGLASARNAGMEIAKGKYIFFLDSDDWIDPCTIEELLLTAEQYQVDFVRFRPMYAGWPGIEDGTLCDFGTEKGITEGLYEREQIEKDIFPRMIATEQLTMGVIVAAWRSMYRTDFLKKNNIRFYDRVKYSEDTIFSANVVYHTQSFYYLDGPRFYHYYYNKDSISKSFKADRWESCKELLYCFQHDFGKVQIFDKQLRLMAIFLVLLALGQKDSLMNLKERTGYCRKIMNDPVTVEAMRYIGLTDVSQKLRIRMNLIRLRFANLYALL